MNELKILIHYLKRKVQELIYVQNCNIYKEKRENRIHEENN